MKLQRNMPVIAGDQCPWLSEGPRNGLRHKGDSLRIIPPATVARIKFSEDLHRYPHWVVCDLVSVII